MTRAQHTILAVVFTLIGMGFTLWIVDIGEKRAEVRVNEIDLETTLRVPGENGFKATLPPPGEVSEENLNRPRKSEGLPPRPEPQPPLNDAAAWRAQRDEMARIWMEDSIRGVEAYSAKAGLSAEQREKTLALIFELHERYEQVRERLEERTTTRDDARIDIGAIDEWGQSQLEALLGVEGAELLRVEMEANRTNL